MRLCKLAASVLAALALKPAAAVTVNYFYDDGPGNCTTTCSLRDAVATAASGETIDFALAPPATQKIRLDTALTLSKPVTIAGPGAAWLTLDGESRYRVLEVHATSTISGVTIANGLAPGPEDYYYGAYPGFTAKGGCILTYTSAALTLSKVSMVNCAAEGGEGGYDYSDPYATGPEGGSALGGAIFADGPLTVRDSSITGSHITGGRGGGGAYVGGTGGVALGCAIYTNNSDVTISNSTISGCQATGGGGGPMFCSSTYGGRGGVGGAAAGGALFANGNTTNAKVQFSTLAGNGVTGGGAGSIANNDNGYCTDGYSGGVSAGGIDAHSGGAKVTITSSVVAADAGISECTGNVVAEGDNFDQHSTCAGFTQHGTMGHEFRPLSRWLDGTWSYYPRFGIVVDAVPCPADRTTDQHDAAVPIGPNCDLGAVEADYTSYVFADGME